jgi:hypothetical protein
MKNKLYTIVFTLLSFSASAQTPADGLTMNHRQVCIAALYGNNAWDQYWEGPVKITNANIGTVTHQSAMLMGAVGLTERLNLIASLPYITSQASQGQFAGQQGIQDLSLWLKYRVFDLAPGKHSFKVFALGGLSAPVSNYVPDFMPFCIGLGSRTATARAVIDYQLPQGIYLTLRAGHTWRSNIFIDRDAYQFDGKLYYTNEVPMPNIAEGGALLGWRKGPWVTALTLDHFTCRSGDDIRPNDMPFPTNLMRASTAGIMGKYQGQHWGITLAASQVFAGRNVGQSRMLQGGLLYLFQYNTGK